MAVARSKRRMDKAPAVINLHQIQLMVYGASLIHPTRAMMKCAAKISLALDHFKGDNFSMSRSVVFMSFPVQLWN